MGRSILHCNFLILKLITMIKQLKAERKRQKISRAAIAPKLGVTEATLFNWESGKNDITFGKFLDYAKLLGIEVSIEFQNEQNNKVNQALQVIERLTQLKLPKSLNDRNELDGIYTNTYFESESLTDEEIEISLCFNDLDVWFDYVIERDAVIEHFYTTNSQYEALVDMDYVGEKQAWVSYEEIELDYEQIFDYLVRIGDIANYLQYQIEQ
jgi:transcriptional regulator with XRE-family HTH domain